MLGVMERLRTPDDRFADLPDFAYAPRYVEVAAGDGSAPLRMAYVDEGPRAAPVVLLLHGEPSGDVRDPQLQPRMRAPGDPRGGGGNGFRTAGGVYRLPGPRHALIRVGAGVERQRQELGVDRAAGAGLVASTGVFDAGLDVRKHDSVNRCC